MRAALAVVGVICALSVCAATAFADKSAKPDSKLAEALKVAKSGDKQKAEKLLQELYESSGDSEVLFILGGLQEDMGHYTKAYMSYRNYVVSNGSGKHAGDARKRLDALASKAKGQLRIVTQPEGAEVYRGSELVGRTPVLAELSPGEHTLRITKAGFRTKTETFKLEAGGVIELSFRLEGEVDEGLEWAGVPNASDASENQSELSIRTDVTGALVTIDGVLVGTTLGRTAVKTSVSSGVHAVTVQRYGHKSWGAHVRAEPGATLQLDLRLGREQSRGAKLASWSVSGLGAASVLAGVGIGVGALLDSDENLAESADVMILGGLTAIAAGVVIHWVTRSRPTRVKLRTSR